MSEKMGSSPVKVWGEPGARFIVPGKKGLGSWQDNHLRSLLQANLLPTSGSSVGNRDVNVNSASCWTSPALQDLCPRPEKQQGR